MLPATDGRPGALSIADLDALLTRSDDAVAPKTVSDWVKSSTGKPVKDLVASPDFQTLRRQVHGSLVTALTSSSERSLVVTDVTIVARDTLLRAVRLLGLLEALADPGLAPADASAVRRMVRLATVVLPDSFRRPADALARPPAVADLKIVKVGPARYEPGAIAHIENVLASEKRERTHRVLDQTEETTTLETEHTDEREQDLATTSRTELLQESSAALHESLDLEAGLSVSAAYGPTVRVEADARVARQTSSEEVTRASATFANEVVKRTRERIVERTVQTRVVRRLHETEETNTHGFENTGQGAKSITGVYRWVDSVQDAWLENYGKRLMVELLVPEPAAYLRWAAANAKPAIDVGDPPEAPRNPSDSSKPLEPGHIDAANYMSLCAQHGAQQVSPPPAASVDLAASWKPDGTGDLYLYSDAATLKVPVGYRATAWEAQCATWGSGSPDGEVWMAGVGATGGIQEDNSHSLKKTLSGSLSVDEGSAVPVLMLGRGLISLAATVRVHCELTDSGRAKWQLAVYDAIMTAYRARSDAYQSRKEQADAAMALGAVGPLDSGNPTENQLIERRELRRGAINMLLGQPEDQGLFAGAAVTETSDGPVLDLQVAAVERDAIAFFEQAFEWSNMTWVHYPYYWSDRAKWQDDCRRSGTDASWTAFVTAGATRTVIPVRPGLEPAVALYLATGILWAGGQVPTVGDPAYLAIDDEVVDALGTRPADAPPPERTPLEPVRLPTSLVWLQPTADLNPPSA